MAHPMAADDATPTASSRIVTSIDHRYDATIGRAWESKILRRQFAEAARLYLDDSKIKTPVHHSQFTSKESDTNLNLLNRTLPGYINQDQDHGYRVITVTRVRGPDHGSVQ